MNEAMIAVRNAMVQSQARHHVVVWDPKGEYWEGGIVATNSVAPLHARGVVTLPIDPDLARRNALAGFSKRSWGGGWPMEAGPPRMHTPIAIFLLTGYESLNWAVRLVPNSLDKNITPNGQLRLAMDTGQPIYGFVGAHHAKPGSVVQLHTLGEPDEHGGWTILGRDGITPARASLAALSLYGFGMGVRVAWVAVTQSP